MSEDTNPEFDRLERRIVDFDRRLIALTGGVAALSPPVFWLKCVTWGVATSLFLQVAVMLWVAFQSGIVSVTRDDIRADKKEETAALIDLASWKSKIEWEMRALKERITGGK